MIVLLHRCRTARLIPCRALTHFAREGYFLAPVYDRFTEEFCDREHADRASPARLAPAASSATLICWRRSCARNSPWTLPTGSRPEATVPLPLIDVRVQWSTRHQDNAAQHAPMREFLLRTLSSLSDALASAQWRPRVLHCRTNGSDAVPRGLRSQQTVTWYEGPEASFDTCSSSLSSRLVGRQQKSAAHPRHPPRSGDDGR